MELSSLYSTPFALLFITLIVIVVLQVCTIIYRNYFYWRKRNIPYLESLPILGTSWKPFLQRMNYVDYSQYIYKRYPDAKYVGLFDFVTPAVLVRDPELIKEIMVKEFESFPDHRGFTDEKMDPILGRNVFSLRGDRWKKVRNILTPSFTPNKMKMMFSLVSKCASDFTEYLVNHPDLCSEMDSKDAFGRYTNDVIATAAFGININSMEDRNNEFYIKGLESTKFSSTLVFLKFILLRFSPRLMRLIGVSLYSSDIVNFFRRIVKEAVKFREEKNIVRPDMIHLLMQARNKESVEMTLDDMVAQTFVFFLAGMNTSVTLMCFIAHELAVNPDIQERLRAEVDRHFMEEKGEISYDTLSKMTYMDMVTSETLRKYSPVILNDRVCVKRYQLPPLEPGHKGVVIEPGNMIYISTYSLHHDPKYFPNPSKFDPERFSDENKDNINPYTYLPFGLGPRMCMGNRFALMQTKIVVAHLLQKFIFKTTEKTLEPIVFDKKQFELIPDGGFSIRLQKREI